MALKPTKSHIALAEAKKQLRLISKHLSATNPENLPLLLIGGLAVNQYSDLRDSEDIDLVCESDMARNIIRALYPSETWHIEDKNNDEYRPSFHITHKLNSSYPTIKFGPKIEERGTYEFLDWEALRSDAAPARVQQEKLEMIYVPTADALCYTKLISLLGRSLDKVEKLRQDASDIRELINHKSFSIGNLVNLVYQNGFAQELETKLHERLIFLGESLDGSSLEKAVRLFSRSVAAPKRLIIHQGATYAANSLVVPRAPTDMDNVEVSSVPKIRVAAFDVDGTLIKGIRHSWTIVWRHLKSENNSQKRLAEFRRGEISYLDWCRLDAEEFRRRGLRREHFYEIVHGSRTCSLTNNAEEALRKLRDSGVVTAIISGGIDLLLHTVFPSANELFDEIFINRFVFSDDGEFIGINATEYDWDDRYRGVVGKRRGLERICEKYGCSLQQAAFVGDDINDLHAMDAAGLKIFYCGDRRERLDLPKEIDYMPENNLVKVADRILSISDEQEL